MATKMDAGSSSNDGEDEQSTSLALSCGDSDGSNISKVSTANLLNDEVDNDDGG